METIPNVLILFPLVVSGACLAYLIYCVREVARQQADVPWRRQLLEIGVGLALSFLLGGMFMSPTGPGSAAILFVVALVFVAILLIKGPKLTRIAALVLGCLFVAGLLYQLQSKWQFEEAMQTQMRENMQESASDEKQSTEPAHKD